ncbi:MAG: SDR family NAD(P)-dependent oxidoreductase [Sphingomonadaceae bacterium]
MTDALDRWAIITGASSGLGIEFAKQLAAMKVNLILVARRREPMEKLAEDLAGSGIQVVVEPMDLVVPGAAQELEQRLDARGIEPEILINNAGFGLFGYLLDQKPEDVRGMLELDILALTELSRRFGKRMSDRGRGHILLVASVAAYQPTPLYAVYGAAKAYVLSFGVSLNHELGPDVGVTVVSPGLMDTGFNNVSGQPVTDIMRRNMTSVPEAAKIGLDAMFAKKSNAVVGRLNRVFMFMNRIFSRDFQAKMIFKMQQA